MSSATRLHAPRTAVGAIAPAVAVLATAALVTLLTAALVPQVFAPQALAREIPAPTRPDGKTMTVSDDITRIRVDKLDANTHEAVVGAKMQILVKETGEVVDEWTTDGKTHAFDKGLDVNVEYILREVEAPEGYEKIADVAFYANEMEATGLTLLGEPTHAELVDAYTVALYEPHEEIVVVEERDEYVGRTMPATGDRLPIMVFAGVAGIAVIVVVGALVVLRRKRGE